ncbi:class I SAM-dependent methyltransferase [Coleofasciculus chthonoplastes]|uniref:class I SAM-dependent methyltransferase n=1 Tax=Coleofasciculus chthonoplastes TaxID=64178 RepID=UPI0032FFB697
MNKQLKKIIKHIIRLLAQHIKSRLYIMNLLKNQEKIYLEIGAGDKKGENGWVTLDLSMKSDICWDLREGIPFPDESIHKIYSSHLFEHLYFEEGQLLLNECLRVLVKDGIFSICVPNARLYIESYLRGNELDKSKFFGYKLAYNNTSRIDYVNYTAYMDKQHKYMFDEENLVAVLEKANFRNVHLREFDPDLDKQERDFESIYAEAQK